MIYTVEKPYKPTGGLRVLGGNLSPDFSAILKLAGVEGGLENNIFRGKARVFEGEQGLLDALDQAPGQFQNHDMVIVRYEGPSGAPGMPEMLDPTSRITTLCRERGIIVGLMTDARFSGGSVGLVIGHVGPEAALGGPIAFIENGDEIVVDLNTNELNCTALADPAVLAQAQGGLGEGRRRQWRHPSQLRRGGHPPAPPRAPHRRARHARRRPASEPRDLGARAAQGRAVGLQAQQQAPAAGEQGVLAPTIAGEASSRPLLRARFSGGASSALQPRMNGTSGEPCASISCSRRAPIPWLLPTSTARGCDVTHQRARSRHPPGRRTSRT